MSPLEKLNAAAARLVQEATTLRGQQEIRLKEISSTIRGAAAAIRTALEGNDRRPQHTRFNLIVGDKGALPAAEKEVD